MAHFLGSIAHSMLSLSVFTLSISLYSETCLLSLQYRGGNNSHHINTRVTIYIHYCSFTIRRQANIKVQQEYHEDCTTHGSTWTEAAGQSCQGYDLPLHIALAQ